MNNKGFAFIETIITVVILSASLLYLYNSYSVIIHDEEVRLYYDDVAHIYKTNYIRKFLENYTNLEEIKSYGFKNTYINTIGSGFKKKIEDDGDSNSGKDYDFSELKMFTEEQETNEMKSSFENIVNNYHVYTIVLIDTKMFSDCYNKEESDSKCSGSMKFLNTNLQNYIKTLSDSKYEYYLVVQYSEKVLDDGSITKCIPIADDKCKSYYASIGF